MLRLVIFHWSVIVAIIYFVLICIFHCILPIFCLNKPRSKNKSLFDFTNFSLVFSCFLLYFQFRLLFSYTFVLLMHKWFLDNERAIDVANVQCESIENFAIGLVQNCLHYVNDKSCHAIWMVTSRWVSTVKIIDEFKKRPLKHTNNECCRVQSYLHKCTLGYPPTPFLSPDWKYWLTPSAGVDVFIYQWDSLNRINCASVFFSV